MSNATEQQVATSIHTAIGRHISGMIEFLQVPRREQTRRNGEDSGLPRGNELQLRPPRDGFHESILQCRLQHSALCRAGRPARYQLRPGSRIRVRE